jgi:nucleotide-binding universal stress UspA family protein
MEVSGHAAPERATFPGEEALIRLRHVLCPVDFFPASETALSYAASFSERHKARLHILHVIPPLSSFLDFGQDTGQLVKAAHEEAQLRLATMAKAIKASGVRVATEVRLGEIDREVLNAIDEHKANLIVLGTHGRRGLQHWLIGSVCERLLRTVPIPIFTTGAVKGSAGLSGIRRILIGIDFSAGCAEAVSYGFSIAEECEADVTLLHVTDFAPGDIPGRYRQSLVEGIRADMNKLVPPEDLKWCNITTRVEMGIPYKPILKMAEKMNADLIVLGTHGRSLLHRTLLGSNAERVIRGASCPVMAIPPNPKETGRKSTKRSR